jgi:hypothetical protein
LQDAPLLGGSQAETVVGFCLLPGHEIPGDSWCAPSGASEDDGADSMMDLSCQFYFICEVLVRAASLCDSLDGCTLLNNSESK